MDRPLYEAHLLSATAQQIKHFMYTTSVAATSWPLDPHLEQINFAVTAFQVHVQTERSFSLLVNFDVFEVPESVYELQRKMQETSKRKGCCERSP